MIASERWVRHAGERMIASSSCCRKLSPALIPQPSMSSQSFAPIHAKFGVVAVLLRIGCQRLERQHMRGAVGGAIADAGEVQLRQVVVPVVPVYGVVARSFGTLQEIRPGLVRRVDLPAEIGAWIVYSGFSSSGSVNGIPNVLPPASAR